VNYPLLKLLDQRAKLAIGSLALVEKQLLDISTALDNQLENLHAEDTRGQEEKSDSDFFISPPLSAYDEVE